MNNNNDNRFLDSAPIAGAAMGGVAGYLVGKTTGAIIGAIVGYLWTSQKEPITQIVQPRIKGGEALSYYIPPNGEPPMDVKQPLDTSQVTQKRFAPTFFGATPYIQFYERTAWEAAQAGAGPQWSRWNELVATEQYDYDWPTYQRDWPYVPK